MGHARRDEGTSGDATTPRRAAIAGLAGLAALGAAAVAPAAKGKKKGKTSGTLVRVENVEKTGTVPAGGGPDVELALCDRPGAKEVVFVLGGGFLQDGTHITVDSAFATASGDDVGYTVSVRNSDAVAHDITVQAICGYFRK